MMAMLQMIVVTVVMMNLMLLMMQLTRQRANELIELIMNLNSWKNEI